VYRINGYLSSDPIAVTIRYSYPLERDKHYYWQVRYRDSSGQWGPWSTGTSDDYQDFYSPDYWDISCAIDANPLEGDSPLSVDFYGSTMGISGPIVRYWWIFGDDTGAKDVVDPSHTYTDPGTYTVNLAVRDGDGRLAYAEPLIIPVHGDIPPPTCTIEASPTSGDAPLFVSFNAVTERCGVVRRYWWTFGDGTGDTDIASPTHTYEVPGTYTVTLSVRNKDGITFTADPVTITVQGTALDPIVIQASPTSGDAPLIVNFNTINNSAGIIRRYWWSFGDGTGATDAAAPTHTYTVPGTYTVSLSVRNKAGQTFTADPVTITVQGVPPDPIAIEASPTSGNAPLTVNFNTVNNSAGVIRKYWWLFGDGTGAADVASATHTYTVPGTYTVSLSVRNKAGQTFAADPIDILVQ
jgi:PKD repeat protein